jgi:hypothetical protein
VRRVDGSEEGACAAAEWVVGFCERGEVRDI